MPHDLNDLFALFPDLPWSIRPSRVSRRTIGAGVDAWRERALRNISRQKAAAAEVKRRIERRRRGP